jgi:hypothetical protein
MDAFDLTLQKAADLAGWLIQEKGVKRKQAYIIASRKYKIENWHLIQKYFNTKIKTKQLELI